MGEEGGKAPAARLRDELAEVHARIAPRFARREVRGRAGRYLAALLEQGGRRTGRRMAEQMGEETPDGAQRLLNAARWNADLVRDALRSYVVERLGDPAAVLALCEAAFPKRGPGSAGVELQYNRAAGRYENCQVGEFLAYDSPRGRAFIDRALFLPEVWARDPRRLASVGVPEGVGHATKGELARRMLGRAFDAGVPAAWVTSDDERYADDGRLPRWLEGLERSYVLATARPKRETLAADDRFARMPERHWERVEARAEGEGARLYEWARRRLPYRAAGGRAPWLLVRRSAKGAAGGFVYYRALGPQETPLAELARVARRGGAVEEDLERARGEVGLDEYEARRWDAWHRHVTLCLLAHAALDVARAGAQDGKAARYVPRSQ